MSCLNLPGCNLSPLFLVIPNMEEKFILLTLFFFFLHDFLKTDVFQKTRVEFSLEFASRSGATSACSKAMHLHVMMALVPWGSWLWYPNTTIWLILHCFGKTGDARTGKLIIQLLGNHMRLWNKTHLVVLESHCRQYGGWVLYVSLWGHLVTRTSCFGIFSYLWECECALCRLLEVLSYTGDPNAGFEEKVQV